jgi:hypothetical protein
MESLYRYLMARQDRFISYGYLIYFITAFLFLLPYINSEYCDSCHPDELLLLAESKRVLMGEHQHRDFFSFYGGANFYLIALIWKAIGSISHSSIRLTTFIIITLGAILLVIITRHFTRRFWLSLLPSIVFLSYMIHLFPYSNHHWFGSVASIIFLFFVTRYLLSLRLWYLYASGAAAGLSLLFISHEGVMNSITGAIMVAAVIVLLDRSLYGCSPTKLALVYIGGFTTIMLPVLLFYISIGALGEYWYSTFVWPLGNYSRKGNINVKPWGLDLTEWLTLFHNGIGQAQIFFFFFLSMLLLLILPLAVFLMSFGLLTSPSSLSKFCEIKPLPSLSERIAAKGETLKRNYDYLVIGILNVVAISIYIAPVMAKPGVLQLFWGSLPAIILGMIFLDRAWDRCNNIGIRRALVGALAFSIISFGLFSIYKARKVAQEGEQAIAVGYFGPIGNHQSLIDMINKESGPGDYFFSHKFLNHFYYLVNARPATRYTGFVENYLTDEQIQDLIADLYRNKPKFMVFTNEQDLLWLADQHADFPAWLNGNYEIRSRIDGLLVYQRTQSTRSSAR